MSASDPLGSSFFRYRKRKQISADGHTPGLEYQRRHSGDTHAPPTGHSAQHNRDEYEALNNAEQYHPGRRFYSVGGPEYERPQSWHDTRFEKTPPIMHSSQPSPMLPFEPSADDDSPDQPLPQSVDIQELFDPNRIVRMTIGEIHAHMAAQREYLESVMAGEVIDKFAGGYVAGPSTEDIFNSALMDAALQLERAAAAMQALEPASPELDDSDLDPGAEMLETSEQIFGEQMDQAAEMFGEPHQPQSLDDLVEDEWKRMTQSAMPDPMQMMDPYDQFPPGPPGMPMDPFGPMGPGF